VGAICPDGESIKDIPLKEMTDIVTYRGPDDDGYLFLDTATSKSEHLAQPKEEGPYNLALGFRRLSIIDTTKNAAQPMTNDDRSLWLVFNGEIYNHVELRADLKNSRRHYISKSDSEIILALYEEYGTEAFPLLNGMFSFALWDQHKHELYLVRDRLGVKPLYFYSRGETLFFASEIKSLLKHPDINEIFDPIALIEHFTFQFTLNSRTIFKGIQILEPGKYLKWHRGRTTEHRYWRMEYGGKYRQNSLDENSELLKKILDRVIQRQVRSDVPVGSLLSSGIDCNSVAVMARQYISGKFATFTGGFDTSNMEGLEAYFDERISAREVSELLQSDHAECEITSTDLAGLLPEVMWHLDEPRAGISYQISSLAKLVGKKVPVLLTGTGADELFAGYPWRYAKIESYQDPVQFDEAYFQIWSRLLNSDNRYDLLTEDIKKEANHYSPYDGFKELMSECNSEDPIERALYFDLKGFLPALLIVDDRLFMSRSVEARVPFLDNDIIDFSLNIPPNQKFKNGKSKIILKHCLKGILPDSILDRRKQGFTPPDKTWFSTTSKSFIESRLLSETFQHLNLFQKSGIEKILNDHNAGVADHRFLIWSLLCLSYLPNIAEEKISA